MPCMSYDDRPDYSDREWKNKTDKLARIACKAMEALERDGRADLLLLKDDEVREWWIAHQEADRRAREAAEAKKAKADARARALAKLTEEDRVALGIKKK